MTGDQPLVTVGVPVYNGALYLRDALNSVCKQSYQNLEIVISNNCSIDESQEIIEEFATSDPRVCFYNQTERLAILDHFVWLVRASRGQYFMWAADDDLRSLNYVEALVGALRSNSKSVLSFGELRTSKVFGSSYSVRDFDFESSGLGRFARMSKASRTMAYHFYGLWRADTLRSIAFSSNQMLPDLPVLMAAASLGGFCRADGAIFDYYEVPKSAQQRAKQQDLVAARNALSRVFQVQKSVYTSVCSVSNRFVGFVAVCFVLRRLVRQIPRWLRLRIESLFITRT